MSFKEEYLKHKEDGLTDKEICEKMFMSRSVLKSYKKRDKIKTKIVRKNKHGVTENDFKIALENGISRKMVLQRIAMYKWSIKKAITKPINKWYK